VGAWSECAEGAHIGAGPRLCGLPTLICAVICVEVPGACGFTVIDRVGAHPRVRRQGQDYTVEAAR